MAFTERSYPFKRKQEGGDGFWRRRCEITSSRKLRLRVPRVPTHLEPFRGRSCCCCAGRRQCPWLYAVAILESDTCSLSPSSKITTTTFRGLPGPRLGFFLGGSAEGVQRIGSGSSTRSKKFVILPARAIATFFSRSFTLVPTKA